MPDMRLRLHLPEGWSSLILLSGMLLCVTWAISSARWIGGLNIIQWVTVGAIISSLLLAKSIFPDAVAHLISAVYGVTWITYLVGTLFSPYLTWQEKMWEQIMRVVLWAQQLTSSGQSRDPLIFVLFIAGLLWIISHVAVWSTFRRQSLWWSTVPAGLALLINLYYGPPHLSGYLVGYLFCALLLAVRTHLYTKERDWRHERVHYEPDIRFNFLRYGVLITVILLIIAWWIPNASASEQLSLMVSHFDEAWGRVQDHWTRLFSSLRYQGRGSPTSFGRRMTLGGPVSLRDVPIFQGHNAGNYWLAVSFDEYTGQGWINNDQNVAYLRANENYPTGDYFAMRREMTQTVKMLVSGSNVLFGAPEPVRFNIPTKMYFTLAPPPQPTSDSPSRIPYPSMFYSRLPLKQNDIYQVVSSVSVADEQTLRQAGNDYPEWIRQRYLQLPPELPERVRELAHIITAEHDNAYDKATAIETYLRNFPYNESIAAPPEGQDGVDYFLFEVMEGYCDYYASAMAVLARAVGIPARVDNGYTRGEYQAESNTFLVREKHAHAWVEVYFPRYGWVEFEPTASQPVIVRPQANTTQGEYLVEDTDRLERAEEEPRPEDLRDELSRSSYPTGGETLNWMQNVRWGGVLSVIALALLGGIVWIRWWRRGWGLSPVERAYERLIAFAPLIGCPCQPHQTPYEYAALLNQLLPAGQAQIQLIVELYVLEKFAGRAGDSEIARQAWREIQPLLLRRMMTRTLARRP